MGFASTCRNDSPDSYQGTRFSRAARDESKHFLAPQARALPIHAKTGREWGPAAKRSALRKRCGQSVESHLAQEPKE